MFIKKVRQLTADRNGLEAELKASQGNQDGLEASMREEMEAGKREMHSKDDEIARLKEQVLGRWSKSWGGVEG